MKKGLRLVGTVALLVAMYYLLQVLFIIVAEAVAFGIAVSVGDVPKEAIKLINDAQYLKEMPKPGACSSRHSPCCFSFTLQASSSCARNCCIQ